jgi:hypothetical protein
MRWKRSEVMVVLVRKAAGLVMPKPSIVWVIRVFVALADCGGITATVNVRNESLALTST